MLTWWIPWTACLIKVGCVGRSGGRIASWIAFKPKDNISDYIYGMKKKKPSQRSLIWIGAGCAQMTIITKMPASITSGLNVPRIREKTHLPI